MTEEEHNKENNEIPTTSTEMLKMQILNYWSGVLQSLEERDKLSSRGFSNKNQNASIIASIKSLYRQVKYSYIDDVEKTKKDKKPIKDITELIGSDKIDDIIEAFDLIDSWLYNVKKITKFDNYGRDQSSTERKDNI